MTALDLRAIARALGGEVSGRRVLAPGPQHSPKDRSLCVSLAPAPCLAASLCTASPAATRSSAKPIGAVGLGCPHGSLASRKIVDSILRGSRTGHELPLRTHSAYQTGARST